MAKSKFTTTLDTELLKQAKIEAIQLDISVAEFLEKQPQVKSVNYPTLKGNKYYDIAKQRINEAKAQR